jgi:conserved hypothetical protein
MSIERLTVVSMIMSKVTEATIYVNGALVTRTQKFSLKEGKNSVKFEGLPPGMQTQSITVGAEDVTILSVSYNSYYSEFDSKNAKRISELRKKLEGLQKEIRKESKTFQTLNAEEELLMNNCRVSDGKEFGAADVKDAIVFFHERMFAISEEMMETEDRINDLNMSISNIQSEMGSSYSSRQAVDVIVEVYADKDKECELKLSYFTANANWTVYYDLRADNTKDPIKILSKGMVYQRTGEDWTDVMITLSTGNPSLSGTIPELRPWYLNFDVPAGISNYQSFNAPMASMRMDEMVAPCEAEMDMCALAKEEVVQNENLTSVEYTLKTPYTIETSGNGRSVDIGSYDLPATFVYKSVRKLEKDVFLVAEVKEWEGINLLEGRANVFFEGKYVGDTHIDPRKAGESLVVSLGRDKNVIVTRVRGKDFVSKSAFGNNMKASREWVLTARNLKKQNIILVLEDQVPVSVNKNIVVDAVNISGATLDKDTGKLEWRLELEPAASKSMNVKYEVTYPKGGAVSLE